MHRIYLSIIGVLSVSVVYLAIGDRTRDLGPSHFADDRSQSIAVLRFIALGEAAEDEAMAGTVSEEIINALVAAEGLSVAARTSSFAMREASPATARRLGVRYLLEGAMRREGDSVRLVVQLVDGETEEHLWAQRYERDETGLASVPQEIAVAVVDAVRTRNRKRQPPQQAFDGKDT